MKEFYQQHFDDCEYCFDIYESKLPQAEKDTLIDNHTTDAFSNYASDVHDMYAEAFKAGYIKNGIDNLIRQ